MRRALVLVLAAGCGSAKPVPVPRVARPAPPPPPPPACITPPEEAAAVTHATGDEQHVEYCIGGTPAGKDGCFALELATGKLSHLDSAPAGQAPGLSPTVRVETTNPDLKVCPTSGSCTTLTSQMWPGAAPLHAATNGTFAVVLLGDAEHGNGYADVWDVAKAKKVSTFKYARADFRCGDVAMLGDTIYIGASACQGPAARGALYSVKGKKIANVGGKEFGTYGNAFTQIDGATWGFLEESGNKLSVQDVTTGKVQKTIDVTELWRIDATASKDAFGNPGESALIRLGGGKLAVVAGTPANGSVAIVEVDTGNVKIVRAPLCH